MPTVKLIDASSAPLLLRHLYQGDDPGPIVGALAQVPELCEPALPFLGAALGPSGVSLRQKEIAVLRASANLKCRFCTDGHTVVAADSGLSIDEVRALRESDTPQDAFDDPADKVLVAWVDEISTGTSWVDQELSDLAIEMLGEPALIELTVTIGSTMMLARFASAFQLPQPDELYDKLAGLGFDPMPAPPEPTTARPNGDPVTLSKKAS